MRVHIKRRSPTPSRNSKERNFSGKVDDVKNVVERIDNVAHKSGRDTFEYDNTTRNVNRSNRGSISNHKYQKSSTNSKNMSQSANTSKFLHRKNKSNSVRGSVNRKNDPSTVVSIPGTYYSENESNIRDRS